MKKYQTLQEHKERVKRLKPVPKTKAEYFAVYSQNPRLYRKLHDKFKDNGWSGWIDFLSVEQNYSDEREAMAAVQRLNPIPTSLNEYRTVYKQDPRLPAYPTTYYKMHHPKGLRYFLGLETFTYPELKHWVDTLDPKPSSLSALVVSAKHEPRAPDRLHEWRKIKGYYDFASLVGLEYRCPLQALNLIHRIQPKLTTESEYSELRKLYSSLPEDPVQRYGFESFDQFLSFEQSKVFDKEQAIAFCQKHKIQTIEQYNDHAHNTPELPLKPKQINGVSRINDVAYKPSPFLVFNNGAYDDWVELADKYCAIGKNSSHRTGVIKLFFLYFKEVLNPHIETQCSVESELIDPTDWFNTLADSKRNQSTLKMLEDFFNYVLEKKCAHVSEDGEVVYLEGYRMPLRLTNLPIEYLNSSQSETNKRALPFKYIQKARNFIASNKTKTLGDIYSRVTKDGNDYFDNFQDWFEVEESIIDKSDPNCIWKTNYKCKLVMWSPVRIVSVLFQLYTPFRGSQIVWSDSGEADKYKLHYENGHFIWRENKLLVDYRVPEKQHQGLLKPAEFGNEKSAIHLHINTNKTAKNAYTGYDVPYVDERLLPFLVQLREWQEKYNPITSPKLWATAKLQKSANKSELNKYGYKGRTCFLFRNPCDADGQSPIKQPRLAETFAGVLSTIEDEELPLTRIKGHLPSVIINGRERAKTVTNIQLLFTLHSMRVSLITAYIRDAKIAPEIVQKLVGHSSLVMTIYYTKVEAETIRDELMGAEGKIVKNQVKLIEQMIRQRRMDELNSELINCDGKLKKRDSEIPSALYSIMDFGLCPNGRTQCNTGGATLESRQTVNGPVEAGYLGTENCLQCRFFQTGPAFLGGLQMLANEISLECKAASMRIEQMRQEIEILEDTEYQAIKSDEPFKDASRLMILESHYQSEAKRFDGLANDMIMAVRFAMSSIELLNKPLPDDHSASLITTQSKPELVLTLEEESNYTQLDMVCQSASYYQSARPQTAAMSRSQLLDLFAKKNGFSPGMFALTEKQQITVGNHVSNLLLARLGSYEQVSELMDKNSQITLKDLGILPYSDTSMELEFLIQNGYSNRLTSQNNALRIEDGE
jgi:hypothetical protein